MGAAGAETRRGPRPAARRTPRGFATAEGASREATATSTTSTPSTSTSTPSTVSSTRTTETRSTTNRRRRSRRKTQGRAKGETPTEERGLEEGKERCASAAGSSSSSNRSRRKKGTRSEAHAKPATKRDMQEPAATSHVAANKRGSRRRQQRNRSGKSRSVTSVEKNGQRHGGDSSRKERPAGMLQVLPDLILSRISSFLGEMHELKAFRASCKPALDAVRSNDDAALILRGRHSEQQWRMFDVACFGSQLHFLSIQYCNITPDALEAILERHAATLEFVQCNKLYAAHFSEALLAQPERYPALRAFGNCGLLGAHKSSDATNQAILRAWQAVPNGPAAFGALQAVALTNMRLQAPLVVALMSCGNLEELHLAGSFLVDWDQVASVEGAPPARTRLRALEATFVEQSDIDALLARVEPKPAIVNYIKTSTVPHAWGTGAGRICARSSLVARNKDGRSALHVISSNLCAGADIENECATLIRLGADFLQRDHKSRTALHVACLYHQPALLRAVWNASADGPMQILEAMKLRTIVGESPLYVAALKGFDDCVEIMCDAVKRHIEAAPQAERDEVRSSLLHKLVNADLWTPLHGAAIGGHLRCADLLLEIGFHPQMRTKDSETSLHAACFAGHLDMLNKLLAHGGSLDAAAEIVAVRANQGQCADFVRRVLRESGHASAVGDRPRRKPKAARGGARRQTRQAPAGKKNKGATAQKNHAGRGTSVALPSGEPST